MGYGLWAMGYGLWAINDVPWKMVRQRSFLAIAHSTRRVHSPLDLVEPIARSIVELNIPLDSASQKLLLLPVPLPHRRLQCGARHGATDVVALGAIAAYAVEEVEDFLAFDAFGTGRQAQLMG
jgi:hypothetical protein